MRHHPAAFALACLVGAATLFPCTTFVLQGGGRLYFGRNLDWHWEDGLVLVNPRNLRKTAFVEAGRTPARWVSRFGSVTFNQFGRDMPMGGMNEAGLVVENMWLEDTRYPPQDARPEIGILQWIQFQLDTCRTVEQVLATDRHVRMERPTSPAKLHYLLSDATGDCAVIEFLDGRMVHRRGRDLPHKALANSTYAQSLAFMQADPGTATGRGSLQRFVRAARRAAAFRPGQGLDYAFDTLEHVGQGDYTVWRMVYDIAGRKVTYRTRSNPRLRTLDLGRLDFGNARPVQGLDIHAAPSPAGGFPFFELTEARHRRYLETFFARESVKRMFGDLTVTIDPMLAAIRSYAPTGTP